MIWAQASMLQRKLSPVWTKSTDPTRVWTCFFKDSQKPPICISVCFSEKWGVDLKIFICFDKAATCNKMKDYVLIVWPMHQSCQFVAVCLCAIILPFPLDFCWHPVFLCLRKIQHLQLHEIQPCLQQRIWGVLAAGAAVTFSLPVRHSSCFTKPFALLTELMLDASLALGHKPHWRVALPLKWTKYDKDTHDSLVFSCISGEHWLWMVVACSLRTLSCAGKRSGAWHLQHMMNMMDLQVHTELSTLNKFSQK